MCGAGLRYGGVGLICGAGSVQCGAEVSSRWGADLWVPIGIYGSHYVLWGSMGLHGSHCVLWGSMHPSQDLWVPLCPIGALWGSMGPGRSAPCRAAPARRWLPPARTARRRCTPTCPAQSSALRYGPAPGAPNPPHCSPHSAPQPPDGPAAPSSPQRFPTSSRPPGFSQFPPV